MMRLSINSDAPVEEFERVAADVVALGYRMLDRQFDLPGGDGTITDEEARTFGKVLHAQAIRMVRNGEAVLALVRQNYGEQALMLTRAMWESCLQFHYIAVDPWRRARLFIDFDDIYRGRLLLEARRNPDLPTSRTILGDAAYVARVEQAYQLVERYYPNKKSWTPASLRDMATELDRLNEYLFLYGPLCQETHGSSAALMAQFCQAADGTWIYARGRLRKEALGIAAQCLLELLGIYELVFRGTFAGDDWAGALVPYKQALSSLLNPR